LYNTACFIAIFQDREAILSVFQHLSFDDHERVVFCSHPASGLKSIIAVHSTELGPAAGGCRMWPYASDEDAIKDVLRLSQGMSYKNAMAGLPLGGGKAVIIGQSRDDKSEDLFQAFGDFVDSLGGMYVTAEDVGINVADMEIVATRTDFVSGLPHASGTAGGDPSPKTARGIFHGINAAVSHRLGRSDLEGLSVAVQGLGNVGFNLCQDLANAGARLIVADIDEQRVRRAVEELGARAVGIDEILYQQADVLAPCALGGILDSKSIPKLNVSIIAGGANNQLATGEDGDALRTRNILYAPDYVINAGGIINVAYEYLSLGDEAEVMARLEDIGGRLTEIFQAADSQGFSTNRVADAMARKLIGRG
jgi:leucine dehydrogenase